MKIVDGKVVAENDEEVAALKAQIESEVAGLKSKNSELLGKLKEYDPLKGIDPNEYKTLKEQAAKIEEDRAIKAGEFDSVKKQIIDAHSKEKAAWDAERSTLKNAVTENVLKAQITDAITKADGSSLLLSHHVASKTKLDENYRPVVVDDSGNMRVKADGTPLAISDLIAEMKADVANFGGAFKSPAAGGAGSSSSAAGSGSVFANMNNTQLAMAMNNPLTKSAAEAFIKSKQAG